MKVYRITEEGAEMLAEMLEEAMSEEIGNDGLTSAEREALAAEYQSKFTPPDAAERAAIRAFFEARENVEISDGATD